MRALEKKEELLLIDFFEDSSYKSLPTLGKWGPFYFET
jgi:hypothetical protein